MSPCHPVTMSRGQGQGDKVTSKESNMLQRRGALTPGLLLILFGAWLLAQNLGVPLPRPPLLWPALPLPLPPRPLTPASPALPQQVTNLWPLALIVLGLSLLASYFFRENPPR